MGIRKKTQRLTNPIHRDSKFHLFCGLVPGTQVPAPSSDLKCELLALRDSKRDILNVELDGRITLDIDRRLRRHFWLPILYFAFLRGWALTGRRHKREGSSFGSPGQQGGGISS